MATPNPALVPLVGALSQLEAAMIAVGPSSPAPNIEAYDRLLQAIQTILSPLRYAMENPLP